MRSLHRIALMIMLLVLIGTSLSLAGSAPAAAAQRARQDEPLAALVNGQPITMATFDRELQRQSLWMQVQPADMAAFEDYVLHSIIEQVLIEQAAVELGIEVTDAEVDAELDAQAQIAAEAGVSFDDYVSSQLYTIDEYRAAMHQMLLTQKVSEAVVEVPTTAPQVYARHILVADEGTAYSVLEQLQQGADFATLAQTYSLDVTTASTGGALGWISEGDLLQPELEQVIFSMPVMTRTAAPVTSSLGFHIIEVLERREDGPLTDAALAQRKQAAFVAWLQNQIDTAEIERYVGTARQS
ncbi:MAG: hypothetical protein GYB65_24150 [Chloroflexi bacterium]|nr:hypothetical protein [Chloroflexota bacterium]